MEPASLNQLTHRIPYITPAVSNANAFSVALHMHPITLADKQLFDRYLQAYPPKISELTFTNLFSWNSVRPYYFCEFEKHLIVAFADQEGRLKFFQPVGPEPASIISLLIKTRRITSWIRMEESTIAFLSLAGCAFSADRDNWDYLYSLPELRAIEGKKLHAKRRFINRCLEFHPVVRPMDESMLCGCEDVCRLWLLSKNSMVDADTKPLITALKHYKELNLSGIAVFIDNVLEAFCIGEALNPTTFVAHFLKANMERNGLFQFTLHEFAKSIPESFVTLNQEQDLGIEGLRTAKERWYPSNFVRKYEMISPLS